MIRSIIGTIFLAVIVVVVMIYLIRKLWQEYKQRRNFVVVSPLNIRAHHPCLNNLQFNPIIIKSKTFLFYSIAFLINFIIFFTFYKFKLIEMYPRYNHVQLILFNFCISIVFPLNMYLKNPSLKKYLWNDLLEIWMKNDCRP